MSARALASVTISFGLVSIPTKIYSSGESSSGIQFNWLHAKCGSRVKQRYYCPQDDEIVERSDLVKGYEFAKGQYVLFSEDELKALQAKATQTIEITEFLPSDKVDPIYFDKSYYLGPDKGGDRAFKLLAEALSKSKRSAVAKYASRGKQYLVLLRPYEDGLVLQQLRYEDEIRSIREVPLGDASVKSAELQLALQIVDQAVTDHFRPGEYRDEVREKTLAAIEEKVQGKEISAEPAAEPQAQVIDLMEALKASLAKGERKPAKQAGTARTKAASAKKAARKRSRG